MHFEDDYSHGTEDFSEKKKHIDMENYQEKSHFNPESRRGGTKQHPIQIIKFNEKKNIFEFNDSAEEVLFQNF